MSQKLAILGLSPDAALKRAQVASAGNTLCLTADRYRGGKSTGARNPLVKHGFYTKQSIEERRLLRQLLKEADELMDEILE